MPIAKTSLMGRAMSRGPRQRPGWLGTASGLCLWTSPTPSHCPDGLLVSETPPLEIHSWGQTGLPTAKPYHPCQGFYSTANGVHGRLLLHTRLTAPAPSRISPVVFRCLPEEIHTSLQASKDTPAPS